MNYDLQTIAQIDDNIATLQLSLCASVVSAQVPILAWPNNSQRSSWAKFSVIQPTHIICVLAIFDLIVTHKETGRIKGKTKPNKRMMKKGEKLSG